MEAARPATTTKAPTTERVRALTVVVEDQLACDDGEPLTWLANAALPLAEERDAERARAEAAEAEVGRLRAAIEAAMANGHANDCASWRLNPMGRDPRCDCFYGKLAAAKGEGR